MTKARDIASATTPNANAALLATFPHRNLIINGAMQVAQRGTSGTSTADIYTVDRFALGHGSPVNAMTFEQSTDTPDNFKNSLKITAGTGASASTTGYAILRQAIEGQNIAHLGFGTSAAKAITLSFHVKSSLTGTFGISIRNQAGNRAYAGTYVINSANTWEYKTVAIPADTSGTWPTDTGIGFHLFWDLGAGSNYDIAAGSWTSGSNMFGVESTVKLTETTNATFFITGIQLELGSTATPFEHRSYGDELAACQRYYYRIASDQYAYFATGRVINVSDPLCAITFPTAMRLTPSVTSSNTAAWYNNAGSIIGVVNPSVHYSSGENNINTLDVKFQASGTLASNNSPMMYAFNPAGYIDFDSEL
jgi:hypothetical protein